MRRHLTIVGADRAALAHSTGMPIASHVHAGAYSCALTRPLNSDVRRPVKSRRSIDWASITVRARRSERMAFKVTLLIALLGFSVGPVVHTDLLSKVMGVAASGALAMLAGAFLFKRRN